jgi:hypothetical protein
VVAGTLRRLGEIGQRELELRSVGDAGGEAGVGGVITALAEFQDTSRVADERQLVSLSLAGGLGGDLAEQGISLLGLRAPGRQEQ